MKFKIVILFIAILGMNAKAQNTIDWSVEFNSVFDNREGANELKTAETIFFTQLRPLVGFSMSSTDRIAGGIEWFETLGFDWKGKSVRPVLFYRHESKHWSGSMGIFPRQQLFEEMPTFMWGDSVMYFQPDIRGALLQWKDQRSFAEIYIDWRQKQTLTQREAFSVAAHGRWQHPEKPWMAGTYATMNHLALTKNSPADMHIVDNLLFAPYIGADFSNSVQMDSLRIRAGAAITVERNRAVGDWVAPAGGWFEIIAGYKGVRLKNKFYAGSKLWPSYGIFGAELYQGDAYYADKFYDRVELGYDILRKSWGELKAELILHFSPHHTMFYQKVSIVVRFGKKHKI